MGKGWVGVERKIREEGSQEGKERGGRKEGGGVGIGGVGYDDLEMGPDRVPIEVLVSLICKVIV